MEEAVGRKRGKFSPDTVEERERKRERGRERGGENRRLAKRKQFRGRVAR